MRRIGFTYNPRTVPPGLLRTFETFAPLAPIRLVAAPVRDSAEIDATLAALARAPGEGLIIVADAFTDANHALIVALAARAVVALPKGQNLISA